jgi:hypothetical protein
VIKTERTTKIHKFTVYIYGFNDNNLSSVEEAKEIIGSTRWDYIVHPYHEKSIEIEEISDGHPLNKQELPKEDWEKYMDAELKTLFENKLKADKELEEYRKKNGLTKVTK